MGFWLRRRPDTLPLIFMRLFHPSSVREAKVERLVGDKASEQEVGVVVEGVVLTAASALLPL